MARHRSLFATGLAASALVIASAPAAWAAGQAPAIVGPSAIAGFAWSGGSNYSYDSIDNAVTLEGDGTGSYFVIFPDLEKLTREHVDVSSYGSGSTCGLVNTQGLGSNLFIAIQCNASATNALANGQFDVVVTQPSRAPSGVFDYDSVTGGKSQKLRGAGQYNSSGKTNSVRRLSAGKYQLTLPGPASAGPSGTVQVTDIDKSAAPGRCELAGWHGTRTGEIVDVDCFSFGGKRENEPFGVSYVRSNNLMGLDGPSINDRVTSAYAYASRPTAVAYQPSSQYSSTRGAEVFAVRQGKGRYLVVPAGSAGPYTVSGGDVEVTAVGTANTSCYVDEWDQQITPDIYINCVNDHGAGTNSAFTIQWMVPDAS
jgi:hypothetical protein